MIFLRADLCTTGALDGITFFTPTGVGDEAESAIMDEIHRQLKRRADELTASCKGAVNASQMNRLEKRAESERVTAVVSVRRAARGLEIRNYLEDYAVSAGKSAKGKTIWRKVDQTSVSVRLGNWAAYVMKWFEAYERGIIEQLLPSHQKLITVATEG